MAGVDSDHTIVVVLLLLNIFYNFSGVMCEIINCYFDELSFLYKYFFKRQDNYPNLNELSQYDALQKYSTVPL